METDHHYRIEWMKITPAEVPFRTYGRALLRVQSVVTGLIAGLNLRKGNSRQGNPLPSWSGTWKWSSDLHQAVESLGAGMPAETTKTISLYTAKGVWKQELIETKTHEQKTILVKKQI